MSKSAPPVVHDESLQDLVDQVEQRERAKEEKKAARLARQRQKEAHKKQALQEKLVAPVLLLITVIASVVAWLVSR